MSAAYAPRAPRPSSTRLTRLARVVAAALVAAVFSRGVAHAEDVLEEKWRWVHFSTIDGLPSNAVLDVVETPSGTPWVSTTRGIACYDGHRWMAVSAPDGDAIDAVRGFVTDRDDVVWALSKETVLRIVDGRAERIDWRGHEGKPRQLAVSANGEALVLVESLGRAGETPVFRLRDGRPVAVPLPGSARMTAEASFCFGGRGAHLGRDDFLCEYIDGEWLERFPTGTGVDLVDSSSSEAGLAAVLYPVADAGLWSWGPDSPAARRVHTSSGVARALAMRDARRSVVVLDDGRVLVSIDGQWTHVPNPPDWMRLANVLRFRSNGDLWVGTRRGLHLCQTKLPGPRRWSPGPTPESDRLHEIAQDDHGTTWLATADGVRGRRSDGSPVLLPPLPDTTDPIVTGLEAGPDGTLWASSGGAFSGVRRWDGTRWEVLDEADDGTPLGLIHKVRRGSDGSLWLLRLCRRESGEMFDGAVFRAVDGRVERWGRAEWFEDDRVYDTAESPDGSRWFLTWHSIVRVEDGRYHAVERQRLSSTRGFGLAIDAAGHAWAGRRDGGLVRVAPSGEVASSVDLPAGYERVPIWELCFDTSGRLWIATDDGLLCRHGDGTWWIAEYSNRLPTGQLWPLLITDRGLLVGSRGRGVVQLDFTALEAPLPRIDDLRVLRDDDGIHVQWSVHGAWGRPAANEIATRHRLDDGDWSGWAVANSLSGLELEPGLHRVQVEARGEFGTATTADRIEFDVPAPLHRRPSFFLPVGGLVVALLAFAGVQRRRRRRYRATLRRSEDRYRSLLSEAFDAISICDADGTLREVNQRFCDLLGRERPDLIGTPFATWFGTEDGVPTFTWPGRRTEPWLGRGRFGAAGEPPVQVEVAIQHMRDGSVLTVLRDLTERMALEHELERRLESERALREEAQQADARHAALATRLVAVQEEERTRLARALHDEIGQDLTAIKFELEVGRRGGWGAIDGAAEQVSQLLERVRELSLQLHPSVLDDLGLIPAVLWNVRRVEARSDCCIDVRHDLPDERLPRGVEIAAYRIVQEALTNVVRHAAARTVRIRMGFDGERLRLEVSDDGRGFDHDGTPDRRGLGLLGMRERAESLGGRFEVRTNRGEGTTVSAELPTPGRTHDQSQPETDR